MTYIVGLRFESTSAILCDSVVTSTTGRSQVLSDTFLKSGELAPGIIYAYCGSVDQAQRFIVAAKDYLTGHRMDEDFWALFVNFVAHHSNSISKTRSFQILFSERSTGIPRFHIFDSIRGFAENVDSPVTLGTGKHRLDSLIYDAWNSRIHELAIGKENLSVLFPYFYALLLMERSQGFEAPALQQDGAGGYFHFSYQTSQCESRQSPSVYVLATADHVRQEIKCWVYRIGFCGPALVIECPVKDERHIILESSSWPVCVDLTRVELDALHREIDAEVNSQPFYNVCGIGVADPALRGAYVLSATNGDEYLLDRRGIMNAEFETLLKSVIQVGVNSRAQSNRVLGGH